MRDQLDYATFVIRETVSWCVDYNHGELPFGETGLPFSSGQHWEYTRETVPPALHRHGAPEEV